MSDQTDASFMDFLILNPTPTERMCHAVSKTLMFCELEDEFRLRLERIEEYLWRRLER